MAEQDDAENTIKQMVARDPEVAKIAAFDAQGRLDANLTMHRAIKALISMGPDMIDMVANFAEKFEQLANQPGIDLYDRKQAMDAAQGLRIQIPVLKKQLADTKQQYDAELKPRAFREDLDIIKQLALYQSR
jgi:hypothetical protein